MGFIIGLEISVCTHRIFHRVQVGKKNANQSLIIFTHFLKFPVICFTLCWCVNHGPEQVMGLA